jgi:hypothetical protein
MIELVQGEQVMNKLLHVQNIHAEEDGIYIPPPKEHTLDSLVAQTSMLQDLLKEDYVLAKNASQEQLITTTRVQWGKAFVVNFDNYSESSQGHPKTVIFDSPSTTRLVTLANKLIIPLVFGSTMQVSSVRS